MARWRWTALLLLSVFVGTPLSIPFVEAFHFNSLSSSAQTDRSFFLLKNTFLLVFGTLALAIPAGIVVAIAIYRSDLPGKPEQSRRRATSLESVQGKPVTEFKSLIREIIREEQ